MSSLLDRVKSKQKAIDAKKARDFAVNPPPGNSRWRILPHWSGDLEQLPAHDYGQHFIKDLETGEVRAVVVCASKTNGEPCEICDQITAMKAEALAAGNQARADAIWEARSSQKHIVNAVRWEKGKGYGEGEVVPLALPSSAFEQLLSTVETYYMESEDNIFDPKTGRDIIIVRSGSGLNTKYQVMAAPAANEVDEAIVAKATDLDEYVNQITEEKKRAALIALNPAAVSGSAATPRLPASVVAAPAVTPTTTEVVEAAAAVEAAEEPTAPVADALGDVDLDDLDLEALSDVV